VKAAFWMAVGQAGLKAEAFLNDKSNGLARLLVNTAFWADVERVDSVASEHGSFG
jgi:hypothetical protein